MNTNKAPYFDDFDKEKNFQKVLFRAGHPVQARELNQIQSIQHNQTEQFANHIFRHGSRVDGTPPKKQTHSYVTLTDLSPSSGLDVDSAKLVSGLKVVGKTTFIEAKIISAENKTSKEPATLFVSYLTTAIDGVTSTFLDGEELSVLDANNQESYTVKVRCPTCATTVDTVYQGIPIKGKSDFWEIPESTYYVNGFFVSVASYNLLAAKYSTGIESYVVGFDIVEEVVTALDDESLYDNALGYPNYSAEGADRLKVFLRPVIRTLDVTDGDKFVTLARVEYGITTFVKTKVEYAELMDTLAERTYDESGHYTVNPFTVKFKEHLKKDASDTNGYYTIDQGGNENKFVAVVSAGKAYVKGYQVEKIADTPVSMDKARDTKKVQETYNRFSGLSYILVKIASNSSFNPNSNFFTNVVYTGETFLLYNNVISGGLPTGTVIGTAKAYDTEIYKNDAVPANIIYKVYVSDVTMNSGHEFEEVKTCYRSGTATNPLFLASIQNDDLTSKPKIYEAAKTSLIWSLGNNNIKSVKDVLNPSLNSLNYTRKRKFFGTLDGAGSITFTVSTGEYTLPHNPLTSIGGVVNNDNSFTALDLTPIIVNTPTTITINAGGTHAGKKFMMYQNVGRTNTQNKIKTLTTITESALSLSGSDILLTKSDLYKMVKIEKYDSLVAAPQPRTDVTSSFTVYNGVSDIAYEQIKLTKKSGVSFTATDRFDVTYTYYAHSTSGEYFSVDSYRAIVDDVNQVYGYEDIPSYTAKNGTVYNLRDCLDFRPNITPEVLATSSGVIKQVQPSLNGDILFDVEYYLPRIDHIVITKDGDILQRKGISDESPVPPAINQDEMTIYQLEMKPFVYDVNDDIKAKFIENKRYTMRDIGKLETRIKNVEYYTVFSLLEKKTAELSVKDINGFDRFKNGFIVDNFQNYQSADLSSIEYKAGMDRKDNALKPKFIPHHVNLKLNASLSQAFKQMGGMVMGDYVTEKWLEQPYASKTISTNPYSVYDQMGEMVLIPNNDTWVDVHKKPAMNMTLDAGVESAKAIAATNGLNNIEWGALQKLNSTVIQTTSNGIKTPSGIVANGTTTSTTTLTNFSQTGVKKTIDSKKTTYEIDDKITDIKVVPYMRSIDIEFHGTKMRAGTRVYAYFGDFGQHVPVSQYCRPLATNSNFGDPLFVDSNGNCSGIFRVPENKFLSGNKLFVLIDSDTWVYKNSGDRTTSAATNFYAGGLDVTKQTTTLNVLTPITVETPVTRSTVSSVTQVTQTPVYVPVVVPPVGGSISTPVYKAVLTAPVATVTAGSEFTAVLTLYVDPVNIKTSGAAVAQMNLSDGSYSTVETVYYAGNETKHTWKFTAPQKPGTYTLTGHWSAVVADPITITVEENKSTLPTTAAGGTDSFRYKSADPIAQSFDVTEDCFITDIDVYYKSVASDDVLFAQIKEMVNGYPGPTIYGECSLTPSDVVVSTDGRMPTKFTFPYPVFVQAGKKYCFVIGGQSPATRIFIAKVGENDLLNKNIVIDKQPTMGSMFKSQNNETWNADQTSDVKFQINRAKFKSKEMTITLQNEQYNDFEVVSNPFETQSGINRVRVYAKNHGMVVGDKTNFRLAEDVELNVTYTSGKLVLGQTVNFSSGGSGIVNNIVFVSGNQYKIKLKNIKGLIKLNDTFAAPSFTPSLSDNYLLSSLGISRTMAPSNVVTGVLNTDLDLSFNGIKLETLSDELSVIEVDSSDSFIVVAPNNATASGRVGGNVILNTNKKFDMFNVSGAYLPYGASESWKLKGVGHSINGLFDGTDYVRQEGKAFDVGTDTFMGKPLKLANRKNEVTNIAGNASVIIEASFVSKTYYTSPVINVGSFSSILVSNDTDYIVPDVYNVTPNAGRLIEETNPLNGSEPYKYVTKAINLQNPASDLKIIVDIYKPKDSDFDIYVKTLKPWERKTIDEVEWVLITGYSKDFLSASLDEFKELDLTLSEIMPSVFGTNEFSSYKVKIVGRNKNSANPPIFKTFRAIALT